MSGVVVAELQRHHDARDIGVPLVGLPLVKHTLVLAAVRTVDVDTEHFVVAEQY